jgi:hypothetical protein
MRSAYALGLIAVNLIVMFQAGQRVVAAPEIG